MMSKKQRVSWPRNSYAIFQLFIRVQFKKQNRSHSHTLHTFLYMNAFVMLSLFVRSFFLVFNIMIKSQNPIHVRSKA